MPRGDDELAALLYTEGTAGRAKGVMLSHASLDFSGTAAQASAHLPGVNRALATLPLSHAYGLLVTIAHSPERGVGVLMRWFEPVAVRWSTTRPGGRGAVRPSRAVGIDPPGLRSDRDRGADAMLERPTLEAGAVVGRPDEIHGEEVLAFVSLRPGAMATPEELIGWARERIGGYKYPREVHVIDAVPLTSVGKVDRKAVRARHQEALSTQRS